MSVKAVIEDKLRRNFDPLHLDVVNESNLHNVPAGSESHFKVMIVSEHFDGARLLARHRQVNETLKHEIHHGVHALSIHALTPKEWNDSNRAVTESPPCLGS